MNMDVQKAIKPLRKLRRILDDFPAHPTPEDVHDLRTRARRLEAIVHALPPAHDREARRMVKLAKPVRKAAGKVRDSDVLLAKLFSLTDDAAGEGLLRLAEHLASLRRKREDRLHQSLRRNARKLRRCLKRYTEEIEQAGASGRVGIPTAPQALAAELEHWPRLQENNLHEFRIRAKELRYMLQLTSDADRKQMDALDAVKDAAGEWHDWVELRAIAENLLDAKDDGEVLKHIRAMAREKLRTGLAAANRLRGVGVEASPAA